MRAAYTVGLALLVSCAADAAAPDNPMPKLVVTERSATTLRLNWDAMGTTNTYTVDYLVGVANCTDFPPHSDILHATGTTILVTGLTPATRYHIHVHPLPYGTQSTQTVFVSTLAAGAATQAVTTADYQTCQSKQ